MPPKKRKVGGAVKRGGNFLEGIAAHNKKVGFWGLGKRKVGGAKYAKKEMRPVIVTMGGPRQTVGGSKFTDFWTKTIPGAAKVVYEKALKPAGKFIKDNHVLSTVSGWIPHPAGKVASAGLKAVGLGKKKRAPRKKVGGAKLIRGSGGASALSGRLYLV